MIKKIRRANTRCSIREDAHRALATFRVHSDAYTDRPATTVARVFCRSCAVEELRLLRDFGFHARLEVIDVSRIATGASA